MSDRATDPRRHGPDYIDRTIATVRIHRDAENSWPQWANIFADEIEDLRSERDSLAALLQETREQAKDGLYYVTAAIDCLGYQPFTSDEDWAAFIEEHGNAAAYLMSAQSSLEGAARAALSPEAPGA